MRLVFFGTGDFAIPALRLLNESGHEVACAVTAAPKPAGRGRRLVPSPVAEAANRMGIRVLAPVDPHTSEVVAELTSMNPDAGVLAAYGLILRPVLLGLFRLGIVNIHPSLLPAYRGAAPIQRQIMNGETRGGVTLIALSEQVDAGDILARTEADISPNETGGELANRLAAVGAELLLRVLESLGQDDVQRTPQDSAQATAAPRIRSSDRIIDWSRPVSEVHNLVRALSPKPGAVTSFRGHRLLVLRSRPLKQVIGLPPGVLADCRGNLSVACGNGVIELVEVKPEGSRAQTGKEFCNGRHPRPGERLGWP